MLRKSKALKERKKLLKEIRKIKRERSKAWKKYVNLRNKVDKIKHETDFVIERYGYFMDEMTEMKKESVYANLITKQKIEAISSLSVIINMKPEDMSPELTRELSKDFSDSVKVMIDNYKSDLWSMLQTIGEYSTEKAYYEMKISQLGLEQIELELERDFWRNTFNAKKESYSKALSDLESLS